jgi:hypothetical protein
MSKNAAAFSMNATIERLLSVVDVAKRLWELNGVYAKNISSMTRSRSVGDKLVESSLARLKVLVILPVGIVLPNGGVVVHELSISV